MDQNKVTNLITDIIGKLGITHEGVHVSDDLTRFGPGTPVAVLVEFCLRVLEVCADSLTMHGEEAGENGQLSAGRELCFRALDAVPEHPRAKQVLLDLEQRQVASAR